MYVLLIVTSNKQTNKQTNIAGSPIRTPHRSYLVWPIEEALQNPLSPGSQSEHWLLRLNTAAITLQDRAAPSTDNGREFGQSTLARHPIELDYSARKG